ncbi:MAG: hypothetical protein E7654_01875 [Ruminococcaceae bacterium]|nr:hypothetical protein [Oscillospiraceae bacterium]
MYSRTQAGRGAGESPRLPEHYSGVAFSQPAPTPVPAHEPAAPPHCADGLPLPTPALPADPPAAEEKCPPPPADDPPAKIGEGLLGAIGREELLLLGIIYILAQRRGEDDTILLLLLLLLRK